MKLTTLICCSYLIAFCLICALGALLNFPLLLFLCGRSQIALRAVTALAGVCALWLIFWLIAFRPTKFLS